MIIEDASLGGVKKLLPQVFYDDRGFFYESFKEILLKDKGLESCFVQDNHSYSKKGVLRGMHFQPGQAKLINVISGVIFDVFVDIRRESPTFGQWGGELLDSSKRELLLIPDGFAHGFYVISDEAHVLYKVSKVYDPSAERSFRFDDPTVNICWPDGRRLVSTRDSSAPYFQEVFA